MSCSSGKVAYKSRVGALLALSRIQYEDKPGHTEKKAYRCPTCHSWHLTSKVRGGKRTA